MPPAKQAVGLRVLEYDGLNVLERCCSGDWACGRDYAACRDRFSSRCFRRNWQRDSHHNSRFAGEEVRNCSHVAAIDRDGCRASSRARANRAGGTARRSDTAWEAGAGHVGEESAATAAQRAARHLQLNRNVRSVDWRWILCRIRIDQRYVVLQGLTRHCYRRQRAK